MFEEDPALACSLLTNATYLRDEETVINGIRFYGSPWSPKFFSWAFNKKRGKELLSVWKKIPSGVDVLITHTPPYGVLDEVPRSGNVGCQDLLDELSRIQPNVHCFGHIHEGYGRTEVDGTTFVNASICNDHYRPINLPVVVDIFPRKIEEKS